MSTYTVLHPDGAVISRGLTVDEAGDVIMTYDSREWSIHAVTDGHRHSSTISS